MSPGVRKTPVRTAVLAILAAAAVLVLGPTARVAAAQSGIKIAVIDVNRIMTDSQRGKAVLAGIEKLQSEKSAQLKTMNDELSDMQKKFQEGRLSLAEDKLAQIQAQIEDRQRQFQRAREDAEHDVQKHRQDEIEKIENAVFPIINTIGKEGGYTLIFNKFQSGLVYAEDTVDITNQVIQKLDAAGAGSTSGQ
jgi:outer membrane protein